MPKMMIMHAVEDIDRWLEGKEERATALGQVGSNVQDYVAEDGSPSVVVTADIDDVNAMKGMLGSPPEELVALMQKHGVVPPFTVYVEA